MRLIDDVAAHRRFSILRLLAAAHHYALNDSLLLGGLQSFGLGAPRDHLKELLAWLEREGLVTLEVKPTGTIVATITDHGLDVARGDGEHAGVHRPRPSALARAALRAAAGLKPEEPEE